MVGGVRSGRRDKIGLFPVVVLLSLIEFLLSIAWSVIVLLVAGLIFISLVEFLVAAALPVTLLITAWPVIILPVSLLNTIMSVILLVVVPVLVVLVVILSRLKFPFLFMLTSVPVVHLSCLEGPVIMDDRL